MARRLTAAQARDRRSKRMAIGLGALLLVVGVVQGPKLMKQLSPPAPPTDTAAVGATGATASAAGSSTTAATSVGTQLQDFSLLAAKDPFHAQVMTASATSPGAAATPAAATATKTAAAKTKAKASAAAAAAGPTGAVGFVMAPPNAALVKTNGRKQVVMVGAGFPSAGPLFKLVAIGKKGIRIGVLGGSFTSGVPTLLVKKGHRLTLANQADGSRYVVQFVRLTTAVAAPTQPGAAPTTTTPTATTPTATTPTTTTPATTTTTPG